MCNNVLNNNLSRCNLLEETDICSFKLIEYIRYKHR